MYGMDDGFHDLREYVQYVYLGHPEVDQHLQEPNRVNGVSRREHDSRLKTVLREEGADAPLIFNLVEETPHLLLQPRHGLFVSDALALIQLFF